MDNLRFKSEFPALHFISGFHKIIAFIGFMISAGIFLSILYLLMKDSNDTYSFLFIIGTKSVIITHLIFLTLYIIIGSIFIYGIAELIRLFVKIEFNSNDTKKYNKELLDFFTKNDTHQSELKDSIPTGMTLNEYYSRKK